MATVEETLDLDVIESALIDYATLKSLSYRKEYASENWVEKAEGHEPTQYNAFIGQLGKAGQDKRLSRYQELLKELQHPDKKKILSHHRMVSQYEPGMGVIPQEWFKSLCITWYHCMVLAIQLGRKEWDPQADGFMPICHGYTGLGLDNEFYVHKPIDHLMCIQKQLPVLLRWCPTQGDDVRLINTTIQVLRSNKYTLPELNIDLSREAFVVAPELYASLPLFKNAVFSVVGMRIRSGAPQQHRSEKVGSEEHFMDMQQRDKPSKWKSMYDGAKKAMHSVAEKGRRTVERLTGECIDDTCERCGKPVL